MIICSDAIAAADAARLETRTLSRSVVGKILIDGVSIKVAPGELVAIVGQSGAGKSSFLRLINRLDEPTGGTVILDGADYHTIPPRELRRRVGMVMQMAYLFAGTVAANLAFGPRQRGEQLPQVILKQNLITTIAFYAWAAFSKMTRGGVACRSWPASTLD